MVGNVTGAEIFTGINVAYTLQYILLSVILGIIGQFIRIGIGLKKQFDEAGASFDLNKLFASIIMAAFVGGTAGVLYIVAYWESIISTPEITKNFLVTLISVGYAGTDFIEGLLTHQYSQVTYKTEQQFQNDCEKKMAAIEAGQYDGKALKMEVVKKV
jgi:hypothetical protein